MRDPKRIDRMMLKLSVLWKTHPDQRLGQLLENYLIGYISPSTRIRIFHVEDDQWEERLDKALEGK